ncbi:MAG: hypothetical protein V2A72_08165 [Candidatus Omnitrophota bacterium]
MEDMNAQQAKDEKDIFRKFIKNCPYPIQENSIEAKPTPEPDVSCKFRDGTLAYFELTELVDNSVAKSIYGGSFEGGFFTDDFLFENISNKFKKNYSQTCDLIAYYDVQPIIVEKNYLSILQDFIKVNIKNSPFRRVWIYSVHQEKVIFVYPAIETSGN